MMALSLTGLVLELGQLWLCLELLSLHEGSSRASLGFSKYGSPGVVGLLTWLASL